MRAQGEPLLPGAELDGIAANLQPRLRAFGPQARAAEGADAFSCFSCTSSAAAPS